MATELGWGKEVAMNCQQIEKKWIAYFDGKASAAVRRDVESHLAECAACRQRAEEYRVMWGVLDELPQITPSESFDAAVRARVAAEPAVPAWRWFVPSPRLAFAVACLLVLSVWFASKPTQVAPVSDAQTAAATQGSSEADFRMINDLPELENYDVLSNFEALSDLPATPAAQATSHM
ncbi:MAG: zf-HC2 domain-containing protein [Candidatus Acidiferrales bacterium]